MLEESGLPGPGSFEFVARQWLAKVHRIKVSASHADRTLIRLEQDAFAWMGRRLVGQIEPPELLAVIRKVGARGAIETFIEQRVKMMQDWANYLDRLRVGAEVIMNLGGLTSGYVRTQCPWNSPASMQL